MVATPLVALISYKFYRKKEFKNDLKTALFLLFLFNYFFAGTHILSRSGRPTWETDPITRFRLFSGSFLANTRFFFDTNFFNPLILPIFIYGVYKSIRRQDKLLLAMAASFLIGFMVYTSFEFGRVENIASHSIRYTLVPSFLLLLFSSRFIPKGKIFPKVLVFLSAFGLLVSPVPAADEGTAAFVEILRADTLGISSRPTVFFSPPALMHFIHPDKQVYSAADMGFFSGPAVYVYNPFGPVELDIEFPAENCNATLVNEVKFAGVSTIAYELNCH